MTDIRDLSERLWNASLESADAHPVHARYPEGQEILDGVLFYKGLASANTIDTGDGLVMLDTGAVNDTKPLHEAVRRWRPDTPLAGAVFSHHHVDHIFGVAPFEREAEEHRWARPVVYGHAGIAANFDRYKKTLGWNGAINVRQFALPIERFRWFAEYRYPDVSYHDRMTFRRGGLTFELHHARGETDDATWTWIPERRILAPGDLFIWAAPNAGNPQKVQRYAADRISAALGDTAELLESLESQTLALMNVGAPLDRVLHEVEMPRHLLAKPYLKPIYDHPQFILRNIWRLYGGWYDGEPDNLLPAPRAEQAREWVALGGGLDRVLERASALKAEGNLRLACHLVEFAVLASPDSKTAHDLRRDVYAARAALEESSMSRNILNHASLASAQGKRDLAGEA